MAQDPEPDPDALLTAKEVAQRVRVHPETVLRWTREGLIPAVTLPTGGRRYRREDVDRLANPERRAG